MSPIFARRPPSGTRPPRRSPFAALRPVVAASLAASVLCAGSAVAVAPAAAPQTLTGSSRGLPVKLSYDPAQRTLHGFSLEYTCRGARPQNDADVYTIARGGGDGPVLARAGANRRIRATLTGRITRFGEDGPRTIGSGRLVLDVRAYRSATTDVLRGTLRVRSGRCPSASTLRVRVVRRR